MDYVPPESMKAENFFCSQIEEASIDLLGLPAQLLPLEHIESAVVAALQDTARTSRLCVNPMALHNCTVPPLEPEHEDRYSSLSTLIKNSIFSKARPDADQVLFWTASSDDCVEPEVATATAPCVPLLEPIEQPETCGFSFGAESYQDQYFNAGELPFECSLPAKCMYYYPEAEERMYTPSLTGSDASSSRDSAVLATPNDDFLTDDFNDVLNDPGFNELLVLLHKAHSEASGSGHASSSSIPASGVSGPSTKRKRTIAPGNVPRCPRCSENVSDLEVLIRHFLTVHTTAQEKFCDDCGSFFT